MIEYFSSKCEVLSSTPSTEMGQGKRKERKEEKKDHVLREPSLTAGPWLVTALSSYT
jgi:hypothetical protein